MKQLLMYSLGLVTVLLLAGCQNPTDTAGNDDSTNKSGQPIPSVNYTGDLEFGGILATISFEFETAPNFPAAQFTMGYAFFGNGDNAGDVTVNDQPLSAESSGNTTWYSSFSQTNPSNLSNVYFNGSWHSWSVGGSDKVPAFEVRVTSPYNFSITSPQSGTVDISNGLTLYWSGSGGNDSLMIVLVDLDKNKTYTRSGIRFNDGKITIDKADLSGFSGDALLQLVRYNYAIHTTDDRYYVAVAEIVKQATITIQ